eukprot:10385661-Alexandrium_andersonii.AAC.1
MRPLCDPLGEAAQHGFRLEWQAVRRHLNTRTDSLAIAAALRAAALCDSGWREPSAAFGLEQ